METKKKLEKGSDKVSQICTILRDEAIEPAKREAAGIIDEAKTQAKHIIHNAEKHAEKIIADARQGIEQERNIFQSSLSQAGKQVLEVLKQSIEHQLFNDQLESVVQRHAADPQVIAKIINAICNAVEKHGLSTDIEAIIPKLVSAQEVNTLLLDGIIKRLKDGSVVLGDFSGGAQVKFLDRKMMIDLTDKTLKELLANYIRKDFRKLIFES